MAVRTFGETLDDMEGAFYRALRAADRSEFNAYLAGEQRSVAYGRLCQRLRWHLRDVVEHIKHECKFNGDDYCVTCGADGRA